MTDHVLNNMFANWHVLKKKEQQFNKERLKSEQAIQQYLQAQKQWKSSGTMTFNNFNIRLNFRRKWDQKLLAQIQQEHFSDASQFPFIKEYKEILNQSRYLFVSEPSLWKKVRPALSIYQIKPYFFEGETWTVRR